MLLPHQWWSLSLSLCFAGQRYVSWQAAILRPNNKMSGYDAVPFSISGPHYSNYYVQEEADDGVVMESSILVKDVSPHPSYRSIDIIRIPQLRALIPPQLLKAANGYVSEKQQLRIQVEWDETLLLFQATYHKYDDVGRIHNYQMRSGQERKRAGRRGKAIPELIHFSSSSSSFKGRR